jgi:hypothetical protein
MRILSFRSAAVLLGLAALGLPAAHRAQAQAVLSPDYHEPVVSVRLGGYFPLNTRIIRSVGKGAVEGGVDITLFHQPYVNRSILSVDYLNRSNGSSNLQIVPITVGEMLYLNSGGDSSSRPYAGIGAGAYLVQQNIQDSTGNQVSNNSTAYGAYVALGSDFGNTFFLEGRYHFITTVGGSSPSGLQLDAGLRF